MGKHPNAAEQIKRKVLDASDEDSKKAKKSADKIDWQRAFASSDLERLRSSWKLPELLRSTYIHGYVSALFDRNKQKRTAAKPKIIKKP